MKTSWTTYSVETPFSSVEAHVNGSIKRSHPHSDIVRVNDLSSPISLAAPIEGTLTDVAKIITETVDCDSCTVYVAEGKNLVLRAWSNPHPEIEERVLAKLVFDVTRCAAAGPESLVAEPMPMLLRQVIRFSLVVVSRPVQTSTVASSGSKSSAT